MADMTVKKHEYLALVAVDADGTPLHHGERMIETEPGVWAHPLLAAVEAFLEDGVAKLEPAQPPALPMAAGG